MSGYLTPGLGNTNSYLISGQAFLTGSNISGSGEVKISFPTVARSITVTNIGSSPMRVSFDSAVNNPNVVNHFHYNLLNNQGDSWTYGVRCTEVYISGVSSTATSSFNLAAELTCIDKRELTTLSGSGIND